MEEPSTTYGAGATWKLADLMQLAFLKLLSTAFLYIALLAWLLPFIGMLVHLIKTTTSASAKEQRLTLNLK